MKSRESETKRTLVLEAWKTRYFGSSIAKSSGMMTDSDRQLARELRRSGYLTVRNLDDGLEIIAKSFIGIVSFESFTVHIKPRLAAEDFIRLLDYVCGVKQARMRSVGYVPVTSHYVSDLLITATANRIRQLVKGGLHQTYEEREQRLSTLRGKIMFSEMVQEPAPDVSLPCRYEKRTPDTQLNQILAASMRLSEQLAVDPDLQRRLRRYSEHLGSICTPSALSEAVFAEALEKLNRLTSDYEPALRLCRLIYRASMLDDRRGSNEEFPGFLLDMNRLWEDFIERLLQEFLPQGCRLLTQKNLESPYRVAQGRSPRQRPDFVVLGPDGEKWCVVDAKYKFYDERSVDSSDIYQLTVYGLAANMRSPRVVGLYPGKGKGGSEYWFAGERDKPLAICFKSVHLDNVWEMIGADETQGRRWLMGLLNLTT